MNQTDEIIVNEISNLIKGKTIKEIIDFETDNIYNKSAVSSIIRKHIDSNATYNMAIIEDHNMHLKFIPVDSNYKCYEAMSFAGSSLYNMIFENWDSECSLERALLRNQLDSKFLFIPILKMKKNSAYNHYYDWKVGDFSFWHPTEEELYEIGKEWKKIKETVKTGVIVNRVKFGSSFRNTNNLSKQSETNFIHLRPHARNSFDFDLPYLKHTNGEVEITKQSFWLNKKFINHLLEKYKWKTNLKEG